MPTGRAIVLLLCIQNRVCLITVLLFMCDLFHETNGGDAIKRQRCDKIIV